MSPTDGLQALRIRQAHIQQDDIHTTILKMKDGVGHSRKVRELKAAGIFLVKHAAKQKSISRVIFHQENLDCLLLHDRYSRGNLTTDNQKLSMLLTTLRNPSRSTGFAM